MRYDLSLKISLLPLSFCFNILSNCLNSHCDLSVMFIFSSLCTIFYLVFLFCMHACMSIAIVYLLLFWMFFDDLSITSLLIWSYLHSWIFFESIHSLFSSNWIDTSSYKTLLLQLLVHHTPINLHFLLSPTILPSTLLNLFHISQTITNLPQTQHNFY